MAYGLSIHTDFDNLERRNSPNFAFLSPISITLQADYVTIVEDRPIMSEKYCLPVPIFYFWPKLTHSVARSLYDSWASFFLLLAPPTYSEGLCFTRVIFDTQTLISYRQPRDAP